VNEVSARSDIVDVYERALAWTGARVAAATPSCAHTPTPCPDWDVAAVVDHLLAALVAYRMIASDGVIDRDRLVTPAVTDDDYEPVYVALATDALAAWRRPGVLDEPCDFLRQTMARADALAIHVVDVLVHGWDIARAGDEDAVIGDHLALETMVLAERFMTPAMRGPRYWGESLTLPADAGPQDRLLAFTGRDPQWSRARRAG
jgi:uncharacterized protein (TIGR03086 family)